jgi:hypothetical protein
MLPNFLPSVVTTDAGNGLVTPGIRVRERGVDVNVTVKQILTTIPESQRHFFLGQYT